MTLITFQFSANDKWRCLPPIKTRHGQTSDCLYSLNYFAKHDNFDYDNSNFYQVYLNFQLDTCQIDCVNVCTFSYQSTRLRFIIPKHITKAIKFHVFSWFPLNRNCYNKIFMFFFLFLKVNIYIEPFYKCLHEQ